MAKVTVALSRKVSDGQYGSFQANIGLEDDVPPGVSKDSHAAGMRVWCKAFLDETLGDLRKEYLAVSEALDVDGEVKSVPILETTFHTTSAEEKPPLPGEIVPNESGEDIDFRIESAPVHEVVRTPLEDNQATFKVRYFEVAETSGGDKYLKCFGKGSWKREWVPAWSDVAELLFDDIESMDLGEIPTPYPLEATVMMKDDTYKGKKFRTADKVVEWTRVG